MPQQPILASREIEYTRQWALEVERSAELALPASCRHLYVSCIQSNFQFCSHYGGWISWFSSIFTFFCQQLVNLLSAHCCGVFALHLLEVSCQSHNTGRSLTDSANEVWVSVSFAQSDCRCSFSICSEQSLRRKNTSFLRIFSRERKPNNLKGPI